MKISNKTGKHILLATCIIGLFFITRVIHLTYIPIFTDEAIYLWWAKIGLLDNSQRFISLTDGKQPLLIWFFILMMRLVHDPLLAGRLVSVLAGFTSLAGIFFVGRELFRKTAVGMWAAVLYIISPFFLVYDRLALYDSLVTSFTLWSMYLIIFFVRHVRLDVALILGAIFGGGMLTKTNTLFNILLLLPSLVLVNVRNFFNRKFVKWFLLSLLTVAIAYTMYNFLRLSPWFYIIARKNEEFIYPFKYWIYHPLQYFLPNLEGLTKWLVGYFTLPFSLIVLGSLFIRDSIRERLFLWWSFVFPFIMLALFGKVLFPRFLLPMTVGLYILVAFFIYRVGLLIKNRTFFIVFVVFLFNQVFQTDYYLIFQPVNAQIPDSDRKQLFDDWPSGYGVKEVREYLMAEIEKNNIYLATEGTFGLFPAAFELYFVGDPRIEIHGYWPMNEDTINNLEKISREKPTYIVFKETRQVNDHWPLKLVLEIPRGKGTTYLRLYRLIPR